MLGDDGEHYLSTSEIDPDNPYRRGFPFDGLTKARGECNSKMVFTVLDCCYSGADKLSKGSAKGLDKAQEESASVAKDTIREKSSIPGEGKCVLAACKPMQKAFEYKEKGHSFFSYYLSEALTSQECIDKDGDVTPYALNTYIDNKIRGLPAEIRPKQTPFLNCSTAGKIILAHYQPKKSQAEEGWTGSKSDYLLKLLQECKIDEFNKLRKEEEQEEANIPLYPRRLDLRGKDLRGADLHNSDLSETKLNNARLNMVNLKDAKLKDADLSGADLKGAELYGANLTGANLSKADLRAADLRGMIDFSGANLTGADVRGVDLNGMVNFAGAILHDVDFTGSVIDKALINLKGADIRNAKGLPALPEANEYLEALKSFSEAINQQFKHYDISAEQLKPIEESVKELVKEVEGIQASEQISDIKKKNINSRFVDVAEKVIRAFTPKTEKTLEVFTPLAPFSKIIGGEGGGKGVQQIVESIQKDTDINTTTRATIEEDHTKPPSPQQQVKETTIGSPIPSQFTSTEKERTGPTKGSPFETNPLPERGSYRAKINESKKEYLPKLEKKFPSNKWKIILPVILVGVIGIVVAFALIHPSPPPTTQPIQPTQQFLTYQNTTYGMTIQYPSNWIKLENPFGFSTDVATFDSPETDSQNFHIASLTVGVDNSPSSLNLDEYLRSDINANSNDQNFTIIDSTSNSQLAGQPAYKFVFTFTTRDSGINYEAIHTGTIVGSKVYYINAHVEANQYSNYLPTIQKMIDSFQITAPPTSTITGSNMTAANMTTAPAAGGNMTS